MGDTESDRPHSRDPWPSCKSDQVRVMVLGTYHMDNPGLDENNINADDVLTEHRQSELRECASKLADWNPDRIAVERPSARMNELNDRYDEYRSGQRAYDHEETFPAPHSKRNEPTTECRSEVVQIGFRVAEQLDHTFVAAVDEHPDESRYDSDPFETRETASERKTPITLRDPVDQVDDLNDQLSSSTITEFHRHINTERELSLNHELMFDRAIRVTGESLGSPLFLERWYGRNIRMVHHLWETMEPTDERILFPVGSGHVRVLRHLLSEAPMFCPVSPIPYLSS